MRKFLVFVLPLSLSLGACATTKTFQAEPTMSAIRSAEELGAANVPQATLHLQLAKESMARATEMEGRGDHAEAVSQLQRAEADAELALAMSREDAQRLEATAAVERVHALQSENPYSPGGAK